MANPEVNVEDRLAINDLMMKYVWSFDTGDVDGIVEVFAPDRLVKGTGGDRHQGSAEIRRYYGEFVSKPHFRGGMHYLQQISIRRTADGYASRSYCAVIDAKTKAVRSQSCTDDSFIKIGRDWRLKERLLTAWTVEAAPWKGAKPESAA